MPSRNRYVVLGIIGLAVIAAIPLAHTFEWVWTRLAWDDPWFFTRDLTLTNVIAFFIATAAATFAIKHAPTHQLAYEVVDELAKVTWPTREETGHATIVVIVTVTICSVYLGVFDAVWLWVTDLILGVQRGMPS